MALGFVIDVILKPIIDALCAESISRAYRWWTASDSSDHEAQLSKLKNSLKNIQCRVNDAERRQGREGDDSVRLWLKDFQRLVYDVKDVQDDCNYEDARCRVETRGKKKRKRSSFTSNIVDKIKDISARFDELQKSADELKLETCEFHPTAMQSPLTDSLLGDSKVFGREDDVSRIFDMLDDLREKPYPVSGVSIVGMGGLGKTTVAKLIYKKAKEEKRYNIVAWVCVSNDFNVETILREMLEHSEEAACPQSFNKLTEALAKKLEEKTFLLVLDDVWNKDQSKWNALSDHLSRILKTTRNSIVVTTRDERVASKMMKMNLMQNHKMHKLSNDECWSIIEETVLRLSRQQSISSDLKDIGVEIAKKCAGLPLFATVIGATLSNGIQTGIWEAIRDNNACNLNSKEGKSILSILKKSFDHLPPPLKKCFLYCSIFPKDFTIEKDDLVQLWMAQGFLDQHNESSMTIEEIGDGTIEEIGDAYFNYLLSNSLFEDVEEKSGVIPSCRMHDAMHDLALLLSKDETLILKSDDNTDKNATFLHLRVKYDGSGFPNIPTDLCQRLHSLFIEEDVAVSNNEDVAVFNDVAFDLKSLLSLKLVGTNMKLLDLTLGELKHLRYLDISSSKIKVLPKSFCKLYNLQTFRIKLCHDLNMPKDMTNLVNLRHIDIRFSGWDKVKSLLDRLQHLTALRELTLDECSGVEAFPEGLENLTSLQRLSISCCRNLKDLFPLQDLKSLIKLRLGPFSSELEEFPGLNCIRHLHASLKYLRLEGWDKVKFLPDQIQHLTALESLTLEEFNGVKVLPEWLGNLSSLQLLSIRNCRALTSMPSVEAMQRLSNLRTLSISQCPTLKKGFTRGRAVQDIKPSPNNQLMDVLGKALSHKKTQQGEKTGDCTDTFFHF